MEEEYGKTRFEGGVPIGVQVQSIYCTSFTRKQVSWSDYVISVPIEDINVKDTRGHILKWDKPECIRHCRKFFSHKVGRWNSLDQETVDAPSRSINAF